jgi:hypothetical protein
MSNHPNNDKIFKEARKSLLREGKLLKNVYKLDEITIEHGKEPFWAKLLRIIKGEELPVTRIKVSGK